MNTSETISSIAKALSDYQAEITNPPCSADNPFFSSKYAPLDKILELSRPILAKNGLSVVQEAGSDGTTISVTTRIIHSSGEWMEFGPLSIIPTKKDPQGLASGITYARRYSLSAALGIAGDPDDDGNVASQVEKLSSTKMKNLMATANECGFTEEQIRQYIKKHFGKDSKKDLTDQEADKIIVSMKAAKK